MQGLHKSKVKERISSTRQPFNNHLGHFLPTAEVHVGEPGCGFRGPLERSVRSFPPAWTGEVQVLLSLFIPTWP